MAVNCALCPAVPCSEISLVVHMAAYHSKDCFQCRLCLLFLPTRSDVMAHFSSQHSISKNFQGLVLLPASLHSFACMLCDDRKLHLTEKSFMEHMEIHNLSVEVLGRWQQKFKKMCRVCEKEVNKTEAHSEKHTCEGVIGRDSVSFKGMEQKVEVREHIDEHVSKEGQEYEKIDSSDLKFVIKKGTEKRASVLQSSSPVRKRTCTSFEEEEEKVLKGEKEKPNLEVKSRDSTVEGFHNAVAATVMSSLKQYYKGTTQFQGVARIRDEGMYTELARSLSHRLRQQIKASHLHLQGDLGGLQLTADHREIIKVEVESYCEKLPVI